MAASGPQESVLPMNPSPTLSRRPGGLPPAAVMMAAVAVGLAVVGMVLTIAHRQPWLGLTLRPGADEWGRSSHSAALHSALLQPASLSHASVPADGPLIWTVHPKVPT